MRWSITYERGPWRGFASVIADTVQDAITSFTTKHRGARVLRVAPIERRAS